MASLMEACSKMNDLVEASMSIGSELKTNIKKRKRFAT